MNDSYDGNPAPAEPETDDQLSAGADQHQADQYGDQEGDTAAPDGDDGLSLEDWQSVGVEDPDEPPADPSGYGLISVGDEAVDQALQAMIEANDPELDRFAEAAHKMGLSTRQFAHVVGYYTAQMVHRQPTWDAAAEVFGKDADTMLDQLDKFGAAYLSARTRALIQQAQPSPALLSVLSDMMLVAGLQPPGSEPTDNDLPDDGGNVIADRAQLKQLMASEKYRRGDPATIAAVRNGFAKLTNSKARGFPSRNRD